MWLDERGSGVLSLPECHALLALGCDEGRHGHLGVPTDGAPVVLPLDYCVLEGDLVVQVGEGLFERVVGRQVAFQVDGVSEALGAEWSEGELPWSVLVRGPALEAAPGSVGRIRNGHLASPGDRLVRIRADVVTGRRLGELRAAATG